MLINVTSLDEDVQKISGDMDSQTLGLEKDTQINPTSDIHYDLEVQLLGSEILVRGSLELNVDFACGRCAEFFSTTLKDSSLVRAYQISEHTDIIDISEDLREDLLLNLPQFPVCSEDCKGLCPVCRTNLNKKSCDCKPVSRDDRWGALNDLNL